MTFASFWAKNPNKKENFKNPLLTPSYKLFVYLWPENQVSWPKIKKGDIEKMSCKDKNMSKLNNSKFLGQTLVEEIFKFSLLV